MRNGGLSIGGFSSRSGLKQPPQPSLSLFVQDQLLQAWRSDPPETIREVSGRHIERVPLAAGGALVAKVTSDSQTVKTRRQTEDIKKPEKKACRR